MTIIFIVVINYLKFFFYLKDFCNDNLVGKCANISPVNYTDGPKNFHKFFLVQRTLTWWISLTLI